MQKSDAVRRYSARLFDVWSGGNRTPPSVEIRQHEHLAYLCTDKSVSGYDGDLLAERKAKVTRNPVIRVQQRGGRDACSPEYLYRGNAPFPQIGGDVEQGHRIMSVGSPWHRPILPLAPNGKACRPPVDYNLGVLVTLGSD
jgi:hypothetical protein